ncbi:hypothetical protein [Sarcina ventriculi]|uniref:hypothetical protein n=1 Tax=Sarcina ventriculi TaxID=1267 RepID=UPI00073ED058|nr:hypothetical protein [Sarcina ventriculi]
MLVSLICRSISNDNLIDTIKKGRKHIEEYKYISLFYKINELIPQIIKRSLEYYKDTPENEKKIRRTKNTKRINKLKKERKDKFEKFKSDIKIGIDMSIKVYDLIDIYYREKVKNEIQELLIKINFMSYESKSTLINILKKEIHRTEKRKINQNNEDEVIQKKLDEIENNTAMKGISCKEIKEIENEGGSFLANLARREFEN